MAERRFRHSRTKRRLERKSIMEYALTESSRGFHTGNNPIPPDLVVKFQPIDIVDVILRRIMQLRVGYVQKIKR